MGAMALTLDRSGKVAPDHEANEQMARHRECRRFARVLECLLARYRKKERRKHHEPSATWHANR
jgi:hypothetical protein